MEGNRLIQTVDHTGAAYPVIADPRISFGWSIYVKFNKNESRSIGRHGSYFGILAAACGMIPNPAIATGCGIIAGAALTNLGNIFQYAAQHGRCVEMRFGYGPIPTYQGAKHYRC